MHGGQLAQCAQCLVEQVQELESRRLRRRSWQLAVGHDIGPEMRFEGNQSSLRFVLRVQERLDQTEVLRLQPDTLDPLICVQCLELHGGKVYTPGCIFVHQKVYFVHR